MRLTKIKKTYLVAVAALAVGAMICLPRFASAAVTGVCSSCHTMHNSQNGSPMTWNAAATPNDNLLRGNCLQCHTGTPNAGPTPYVLAATDPGSAGPGKTLAGGNFWWTTDSGNTTTYKQGHNVDMLGVSFGNLTSPPGYSDTIAWSARELPSGLATDKHLTCAGAAGCHGNRTATNNFSAVHGAHHSDPGGLKTGVATTTISIVANSFRFLSGVAGVEDPTWEYSATANTHNGYKGVDRSADSDTTSTPISFLCAECHGAFHDTAGSAHFSGVSGISSGGSMASPWVRHPTDFDMGTVSGADYTAAMNDPYKPNVPVGRINLTGSATISTIGSTGGVAIVMCISCHRAHGSPYADLLRWKYSDMDAGTTGSAAGTGCFTCHTTKDGV